MTPSSGPIWVIASHFNPQRSDLRIGNYRRFRAALDAPLATVEATFDGPAELTADDADIYGCAQDADILWQKERLLNLALRKLPAQCEWVAWLDCDVLMLDPDWQVKATKALSHAPVIQLFSTLEYLGRDAGRDTADQAVESVAARVLRGEPPEETLQNVIHRTAGAASPGMAWAARRDLLERHGFFDACIIGGGDTAMACAAFGVPEVAMRLHHMNANQAAHYLRWAEGFHRDVKGRVGVLDGRVQHLWHGELAHRQAGQRHVDLAKHDFDPLRDLRHGRDGAWRWSSHKPELHALLQRYFSARKETG